MCISRKGSHNPRHREQWTGIQPKNAIAWMTLPTSLLPLHCLNFLLCRPSNCSLATEAGNGTRTMNHSSLRQVRNSSQIMHLRFPGNLLKVSCTLEPDNAWKPPEILLLPVGVYSVCSEWKMGQFLLLICQLTVLYWNSEKSTTFK